MQKSSTICEKVKNFFTYEALDANTNEKIRKVAIGRIVFVGALVAACLLGMAATGALVGTGVFGLWGAVIWSFLRVATLSSALKVLIVILSTVTSGALIGGLDLATFFIFYGVVTKKSKKIDVKDEKKEEEKKIDLERLIKIFNELKEKNELDKLEPSSHKNFSLYEGDKLYFFRDTLVSENFPANFIVKKENLEIIASANPTYLYAYNKNCFWEFAKNTKEKTLIVDLRNKKEYGNTGHDKVYWKDRLEKCKEPKEYDKNFDVFMPLDEKEKSQLKRIHYGDWVEDDLIDEKKLASIVNTIENNIEEGFKRLIVHCRAGIGRTGLVIIALLIKEQIKNDEIKLGEDLNEKIVKNIFKFLKNRSGGIYKSFFLKKDKSKRFRLLLEFAKLCLSEKK